MQLLKNRPESGKEKEGLDKLRRMPDGMDDVLWDDVFPGHILIEGRIRKRHQLANMYVEIDGNVTALADTKRGTIIGNGKVRMIFLTCMLMILPAAQLCKIITGHCREI